MKTQLKLLALAIAAFNLAQASDQGDDLGLGGNEKRLRIPDQNRQLNEEGVNKLEMVKPQSRSYLGSLWGMASNGLSALRNAPHYVASAAYNAWYETPTQKDASVEKKVSVVTESETAMAKKATASKEPREANDAVARKATAAPAKELKEVSVNDNEKSAPVAIRVEAAHTEEAKAAPKKAAVAAKGKKKGKKLAQVPVIVKRRAVEDPTSAAAKIEALPYVAEEALMETTNKKEKAKIKKGLKELSDRRGRIAISMEESAKLENAIETAWKKADAIKKREEIKQNKAAVKEARIATKIAIRRDAANRKAQAEKSGKAPELTTQQRFNEAQKALKDRGVSFNIKE